MDKFSPKYLVQMLFLGEHIVLSNAHGLTANGNLFAPSVETYDIIISNPPYFKLPINDKKVQAAMSKPNKGQYIRIENPSRSILIPNKNYIFLRRFSSKEDESRLIAAPYFCNFIESELIGIENKVNYIYRPKGHLLRDEIVGLCALLNSDLYDNYFRIFNGNVNVSATEIRELNLPPLETIRQIGNSLSQFEGI